MRTWTTTALTAILVAACGSDGGDGGCDPWACDDTCQESGFAGGLCQSGTCNCVGAPDGTTDAPADTATDTGGDTPADTGGGFGPTPGTEASVDRTEPCSASEVNDMRHAPADYDVVQACFDNYFIWAPVACDPMSPCTCDASQCLAGEVAKPVNAGEVCICLNPCTDQSDGATCGTSGERPCIPVDDWTGTQVFICGGAG